MADAAGGQASAAASAGNPDRGKPSSQADATAEAEATQDRQMETHFVEYMYSTSVVYRTNHRIGQLSCRSSNSSVYLLPRNIDY